MTTYKKIKKRGKYIYLLQKGKVFAIYNAKSISGSEVSHKFKASNHSCIFPVVIYRCIDRHSAIQRIRETGGGTLVTMKEFKFI